MLIRLFNSQPQFIKEVDEFREDPENPDKNPAGIFERIDDGDDKKIIVRNCRFNFPFEHDWKKMENLEFYDNAFKQTVSFNQITNFDQIASPNYGPIVRIDTAFYNILGTYKNNKFYNTIKFFLDCLEEKFCNKLLQHPFFYSPGNHNEPINKRFSICFSAFYPIPSSIISFKDYNNRDRKNRGYKNFDSLIFNAPMGKFAFEDCDIETLLFNETIASLSLSKCNITAIQFPNQKNNKEEVSKTKIITMNVLNKSKIDYVSAGVTSATSLAVIEGSIDPISNFKNYDNVLVKGKSKIYNLSLEGGNYPSNSLVISRDSEVFPLSKGNKEEPLDQRRLYQLFKREALKRHDTIQAFFFYARELKAHQKVLRMEKDQGEHRDSLGDRISLCFNRWVNDFGLSWFRPLILILVANIIFSALYMLFCKQGLDIFLKLLDITAKPFDNVPAWDIPRRFIYGYLYYSLIIGFRKFSRKP